LDEIPEKPVLSLPFGQRASGQGRKRHSPGNRPIAVSGFWRRGNGMSWPSTNTLFDQDDPGGAFYPPH